MSDVSTTSTVRRRPWLAGLLSLLLPGLGQLYNRNTRLAWLLLAVAIFLSTPTKWLMAAVPPTAGLAAMIAVLVGMLAIRAFAVVHSVLRARRIGVIQPAWFNRWYVYVGLYLLVIIGITVMELLPVSSVVSYNIPSSAMAPTLIVGDRLEAKTNAFADTPPARGDIILFEPPTDPSVTFVKRVIGLPGDRVQLRDGRLYINDVMVERQRIEDYIDPESRIGPVPQYLEALPDGPSYRIIEIAGDLGQRDDTQVYETPAGHYFVMGDNRDGSADSRDRMGFVPIESLRDKPVFLYWSSDLSRIGMVVE